MNEISRNTPPIRENAAGQDCTVSGIGPACRGSCALFLSYLALCAVSPVMAGTQIMAGSPQLDAHITGTNEFRRETM